MDHSAMAGFRSASEGKIFHGRKRERAETWPQIRKIQDAKTPEAKLAAICELTLLYKKPVYRFYQRIVRVPHNDLLEVTDGFFKHFEERDIATRLVEEKSFSAYLNKACRCYYYTYWHEQHRKRQPLPDGDEQLEQGLKRIRYKQAPSDPATAGAAADAPPTLDELRARARELAKGDLEARGLAVAFAVFERLHVEEPPALEQVAAELKVSLPDAATRLAEAERVFQERLAELVGTEPATGWEEDQLASFIEKAHELARAELVARGEGVKFDLFERVVRGKGAAPKVEAVAAELGIPSRATAYRYLEQARKVFQRKLWELAASVSENPEDELRALGFRAQEIEEIRAALAG